MDFSGVRTTQSDQVVRGVAQGTVSAGLVVSVKLNGIARDCRAVRGLTTASGDHVLGVRTQNEVIIFDKLLVAAGSGPEGEAPPDPVVPIMYGRTVIQPVETATWSTSKGWLAEHDDTMQGSYGSYGDMRGVAFYGTKPSSLDGATVTGATLWLQKFEGDALTVVLVPISESTRPAGTPTVPGSPSPTASTTLLYRQVVKWELPVTFPQALIDGTIGGLGIKSTGGSYMRLAGRQRWAPAWTLVIDWERA